MGPQTDRAERRALIALLAVFALMVQALWPAAASAAPDFGAAGMVCTGHGLQEAPQGGSAPDKGGAGQPCQHCVCPSLAIALPPPAANASAEAVAYFADAIAPAIRAEEPAPGRGLAAPPPPGRGPPARC